MSPAIWLAVSILDHNLITEFWTDRNGDSRKEKYNKFHFAPFQTKTINLK